VPLDSRPDHVAVAVPAIAAAAARWHDELGGAWLTTPNPAPSGTFASGQLRYRGGAKLELLEPVTSDGFASRFVARFGARIHHITLVVPVLAEAIATLTEADYEVVDVSTAQEAWHEAFLRPSQVGGVIVQVAASGYDDAGWAARLGSTPAPIPTAGPRLLGPTLTHPDLEVAARLWRTLGAEVISLPRGLVARWPQAPLSVVVLEGPTAGPVGLRFEAAPDLDDDPRLGPGTLVATTG
jgi:catechol 2,3-dioxygenase-like lactoylglutathione lyase family enzyme